MSQINTSFTQQHISSRVFKGYLTYLKKYYPLIDLRALCEDAGLPYEFLLDETNWASFSFTARFSKLCIEKTGDPNLSFRVGQNALTPEAIGGALYTLSRLGYSSERMYREVGRFAVLFNKFLSFEVLNQRPGYCELRFSSNDEGLTEEERIAHDEAWSYVLSNSLGYLSAVPTVYGHPSAKVHAEKEKNSNSEYCRIIRCNYRPSSAVLFRPFFILSLSTSVAVGVLSALAFGQSSPVALMMGIFALIVLSFIAQLQKNIELQQSLHETFGSLEQLDNKYREISELKFKHEREMIQRQHSSELADLAAQVAHDIRSPLAALSVGLGQLSQVSQVSEDKRILLKNAISRIEEIANNLLEANRAQSFEPVDKRPVVFKQLVATILESILSEKRLQFRSRLDVQLESDFSNDAYGIFAEFDGSQLKRIISNLINNAVEAIDRAGKVSLILRRVEGQVEIVVRDNGKGISPEILPHLMQKGQSFGKVGGSGLGLYHAKSTLEQWNGSLQIQSEPGRGTSVIVRLPLA